MMEILGREVCVLRFGEAIKALYAQEQEGAAAASRPDVDLLKASQ